MLAASGRGWLADLVDLAGWSIEGGSTLLSLAELVTDPVAALRDWSSGAGSPTGSSCWPTALAHLIGGSAGGLAGIFTGSGTPDDPWLVTLGATAGLPAVAVWLSPTGPSIRPLVPAARSRAGGRAIPDCPTSDWPTRWPTKDRSTPTWP